MGQPPASRANPLPFPPSLLGLRVSGDLAEMTFFQTRRGKTVCYPATSPKEPPTTLQSAVRSRFAAAVTNWKNATPQTRLDYEQISLKASLCATGHNLWQHLSFTQDQAELNSLCRQTGIETSLPPAV